jgi:hypothetical protein
MKKNLTLLLNPSKRNNFNSRCLLYINKIIEIELFYTNKFAIFEPPKIILYS